MLLSELKLRYQSTLSSLYPSEETESIFSIAAEYTLKYSKMEIHRNSDKSIQPEAEKKMMQILFRLQKGEPIQYITGYTEFYDLKFSLDRRVLIPRQETEMLVDIMLKDIPEESLAKIIDLGTGSGCIAVTLSKYLIKAKVTATDISGNAIDVAKKNAEENGCSIEFIIDDILSPKAVYKTYDCIVSNPPYVRQSEKHSMHENVLNYEPAYALFVEDLKPLIYYEAISGFARKHLKQGGKIYLEINEFLGDETKLVLEKAGFLNIEILKDFNNKDRYLTACK